MVTFWAYSSELKPHNMLVHVRNSKELGRIEIQEYPQNSPFWGGSRLGIAPTPTTPAGFLRAPDGRAAVAVLVLPWSNALGLYLEVPCTYNLRSNCSYNPIISRVTVVMGFITGL